MKNRSSTLLDAFNHIFNCSCSHLGRRVDLVDRIFSLIDLTVLSVPVRGPNSGVLNCLSERKIVN